MERFPPENIRATKPTSDKTKIKFDHCSQMKKQKEKIAIFDLSLTSSSPVGSTLLQLVKSLHSDYEFVVFTDQFDDCISSQSDVMRVPLFPRPILFRYILFHCLAPFYFKKYASKKGKPNIIISAQGEFSDCNICRVGFCHKAYLAKHWNKVLISNRLRRLFRFCTHKFNAYAERKVFKKCSFIVVPSKGLADELRIAYPKIVKDKVIVISNPIDIEHYKKPSDFKRLEFRKGLGYSSSDTIISFIALGDFARKGLDILIKAISQLDDESVKVLVIGGNTGEIKHYHPLVLELSLESRVKFVGFQTDTRPYLWASDLFVLPSAYETFSQVIFKAAAAGIPVIATKVFGAEDFLVNNVNGRIIERTSDSLADALQQLVHDREKLVQMGKQAQSMVENYNVSHYIDRWKSLLDEFSSKG